VDRTIRICSLVAAMALASAGQAADSNAEVDLFWQAQRAELVGEPAAAIKNYNRLLGKLPDSPVAVDRLFQSAVAHGDLPSALKAARARELADSGDPADPLLFYVDAWRRKDWAMAEQSSAMLQQGGIFGFMAPILNAWIETAKGKKGSISNATLSENGTTAYYANDQLIYLSLAHGDTEGAERRLTSFPGFGEDYARHMAMSAAEHLSRNGQAEFADAMLVHIGAETLPASDKAGAFSGEVAVAALFSRLSDQLDEQGVTDQALYFARLAQWVAPDSAYGRMTLAKRLAGMSRPDEADAILAGIGETRPQWSWALGDRARILLAADKKAEALALIQSARAKRPSASDLMLLEAQQREAGSDLAGAVKLYRSLVQDADAIGAKNGRRVTYRLLLAQALNLLGDWPTGKAVLEEALALAPQNPLILNSLGYGLLERREDVKRGFELVSKAHGLAPQSPAITDSLGWGHYLNGDYAKAVPLLEMAVEGAINDVTINEHLGDAYWKVGRAIEARYAWRAAVLQAEGDEAKRIAAKIDTGWSEATAAP
jgi:tetratricopeptide (TPR) repeat protein